MGSLAQPRTVDRIGDWRQGEGRGECFFCGTTTSFFEGFGLFFYERVERRKRGFVFGILWRMSSMRILLVLRVVLTREEAKLFRVIEVWFLYGAHAVVSDIWIIVFG